jgi:predicted 3-demethylubiquinone-9 3-methyltransferase (glyoxalase superfamily)
MMQKITPNLWFDNNAEEAAGFYAKLFKNSKIGSITRYEQEGAKVSGMPEGSVLTVEFQIEEYKFIALNGGPIFKFTPAVSFFVNCDTAEEIGKLWDTLIQGGSVLMEFQKYPFAEKYGWLKDKYGLSWQLMLGKYPQKIRPALMYVGKQAGKAEEAINMYVSLFPDSRVDMLSRYGKDGPDAEGTINHGAFTLAGQGFIAMDSALDHKFTFTEAISLMVECKDQAEIDRYWQKLTEGGEEQPCGWLKDKYDVSWQIVPGGMNEILNDPDPVKRQRVTKVFFQMKKIDIAALKRAAAGK